MKQNPYQFGTRRTENSRRDSEAAKVSSSANGSVLLLAFYFPPENTSGAARPYRFYKYLRKLGYVVHVLTASPQDEGNLTENVFCFTGDTQRSRKGFLRVLARRVLLLWVAERSVSWAFAAEEAAGRFVSKTGDSVVISTSEPVISHLLAGRLKRRLGFRWIADFRDPLTGNPFRQSSGIRSYLDALVERWTFCHADVLIANTDATLEMWKRKYPAHAGKMHLIWNGFDPEDGNGAMPVPRRDYRLLVHAGTVYGVRHPGVLLSSLHRLVQRGLLAPEDFRIRMIGFLQDGWARDPALVDQLVRMGCLECDGRLVPKREAARAIASADSLILLDSHVPGGAVQLPAKLFEYVRVGRPIIAITTRNSPSDHLLARSGVRYTAIYPEDPAEAVDEKVLGFLALPLEPVVANRWFWENFEAVSQTRQLAALIDTR